MSFASVLRTGKNTIVNSENQEEHLISTPETAEKLNQLARDVLLISHNTLLVSLRFLDMALRQFEFFPIEASTLLTDGQHILYNPRHVLESYKLQKEIPVCDYLWWSGYALLNKGTVSSAKTARSTWHGSFFTVHLKKMCTSFSYSLLL